MEKGIKGRYSGEVIERRTLLRNTERVVKLSGLGYPKTRIPHDMRSFPIFDIP